MPGAAGEDKQFPPGDPIGLLINPRSNPPRKVNIRGVVKNAVAVGKGVPVTLGITRHREQRLTFAAGVVPGSSEGPVNFSVRIDDKTCMEFQADPSSPEGWRTVSVIIPKGVNPDPPDRGGVVYIHCGLEGPGAFIAHPLLSDDISSSVPSLVALIVVDALRPDALGIYGAEGGPSPNIDRLGREGVVFTRAHTAASFTLSSMASIFTGLFPWQHRVLFSEMGGLVLPESVPTLVESFRKKGYHTAAFSGTYFYFSKNGFARGFDHVDETCAPAFFRDSAQCLNQRIESWIEEHERDRVFLYVHYVDPHAPYYAPEPFRNRYTQGLEKPRFGDVALGGISQFCGNRPWHQFYRRPSRTDLAYLRGLYQGEVAYVDHKLGELMESLSANWRTLLLLTADHGEAFYEHKVMEHVGELHEPVMRVPFILWGSGLPGGMVIEEQVRTIDMMPTLLDLVHVKPPEGIPGRSLEPLIRGEKPPPAPAAAAHLPDNQLEYVVALWPWKIYYRPGRKSRELYRLDRDPFEKDNLAKENPGELKRMESELYKLLSYKPPRPGLSPMIVDDETGKRMRALGYLK